jgi:hypothetical protein
MGDQFSSFEPLFPDHWKMPPGYGFEGIFGQGFSGEPVTFYYWFILDGERDVVLGPDMKTKTLAWRDAWRHYRRAN